MRTLVIGDIHGCLVALDGVLNAVQIQRDDVLITLGDYVDRGSDSKGVIDRLMEIARRQQLIPLLGNHEEMMLDARDDLQAYQYWRLVGGDKTVNSYVGASSPMDMSWVPRIPESHWSFMTDYCRDWYEAADHLFVHGNVDADRPMTAQDVNVLRWRKFKDVQPHESGKVMVCGHTAQKSGRPANLGHAICIDTHVYGGGWLTCLHVESGRYWQANQRGEMQTGHIKDCAE
jgi:serine/threonine protein phosphatase 1